MNSVNMSITLRDIIIEAFLQGEGRENFGRRKKVWIKEANRLISWFDKYY